jgi:PIN domain nuclease of toxin-antitoxin system
MRVLLDTHVLLWAATAPERLGLDLELVSTSERLLSVASVWELAVKQALGKVDLGMAVGAWVTRAAAALAMEILEIKVEHAAAVEHLQPLHRDPFDRMLVAQAGHEHAVLLTRDTALAAYGPVVRLMS